jgi:hypothetical protein
MTIPTQNPNPDMTSFDDDPATERAIQRHADSGQPVEEKRFFDYFAEPEAKFYYLPDGVQYFEYRELREGGKAAYERATNNDIRVQRATGDARLRVDPVTARHTLVRLAVTDAFIQYLDGAGNAERLTFRVGPREKNEKFWELVFEKFPAKFIDGLHSEVQKVNTWVAADDDVEGLKKQRDEINERIERAEEEQAKKNSS